MAREMNHKRVREWKAEALHFHLDTHPPDVSRRTGAAPAKRQSLKEQVEGWLRSEWRPSSGEIDRERLAALGGAYVDRAEEG